MKCMLHNIAVYCMHVLTITQYYMHVLDTPLHYFAIRQFYFCLRVLWRSMVVKLHKQILS